MKPAGLDQAPPAPAVAAEVFGERLPLAEAYAGWLAGPAVERGLIGPREVARLWERHLLNCAVVAPLLPAGARVADVGSGAGLPGLVLAVVRPDVTVRLVEPLLRRAEYLREVVEDLALSGVEVVRGRAEDQPRGQVEVVTARAVAPLERLLGWTLPLLAPGGELLALKGASAAAELADAAQALGRWPVASALVESVGSGVVEPSTTVIRVRLAIGRGSGEGAP